MAKILLVEDDKSLREIYGVRLQAEGYTIVSAGDGEEALAYAIKERPDLIVSDVMMPKISGFDMLDILRSTTETKDIKVIMMTALSSEDQRARGEALGADRYLVKSQVGIEDVVRTVHDVLGDSIVAATPVVSTPPAAPLAPAPEPVPEPVPATMPEPIPAAMPTPELAPMAPPLTVEQPLAPQFVATPPAPVAVEAPVAPPVMPVEPIAPMPAPAPIDPITPVYQEPIAQPTPTPAPAADPLATAIAPTPPTPEPITPAPITFPAPQPLQAPAPTVGLPQPTAPFSYNPPASLGDRIINPLPSADNLGGGTVDVAAQMNQELNAHLQEFEQPSAAPAPQQPQYAAPPQPPIPPLPPQPGM